MYSAVLSELNTVVFMHDTVLYIVALCKKVHILVVCAVCAVCTAIQLIVHSYTVYSGQLYSA
jgi:hypothetical protein